MIKSLIVEEVKRLFMYISPHRAGGIYFISHEDNDGYVKIGLSNNFASRFSAMLTNSPSDICVELLFPLNSLEHNSLLSLERKFHTLFQSFRHKREWFIKTGDLLDFIERRQDEQPLSRTIFRTTDVSDTPEVYGWDFEDVNWEPHTPIGYGSPGPLQEVSSPLSHREYQTSLLVAEGIGNKEIADRLNISTETVKTQISSSLQKLGLDNRTVLAVHMWRTYINK